MYVFYKKLLFTPNGNFGPGIYTSSLEEVPGSINKIQVKINSETENAIVDLDDLIILGEDESKMEVFLINQRMELAELINKKFMFFVYLDKNGIPFDWEEHLYSYCNVHEVEKHRTQIKTKRDTNLSVELNYMRTLHSKFVYNFLLEECLPFRCLKFVDGGILVSYKRNQDIKNPHLELISLDEKLIPKHRLGEYFEDELVVPF